MTYKLLKNKNIEKANLSCFWSFHLQLTFDNSTYDQLNIKSATIDRDYKLLNEKRKNFISSKSKLDQITAKLKGASFY